MNLAEILEQERRRFKQEDFDNLKKRVTRIEKAIEEQSQRTNNKENESPLNLLLLYNRISFNLNNMDGDRDTLLKVREMLDREVAFINTYAITIK
jgi:hypothetical protein